jgi:hypothetical protein
MFISIKYDGFESSIFMESREGKDYRGRWLISLRNWSCEKYNKR